MPKMQNNYGVGRIIIRAGLLAGVLAAIILYQTGAVGTYGGAQKKRVSATPLQSIQKPEIAPPARLIIPSLEIDTSVRPVGLTLEGALDVIDSYEDVGWYNGGPVPGAPGNSVIEGHFDTNDRAHPKAVFYYLNKLQPGDSIYVVNTQGQTFHFSVLEKRRYPYDASPPEVFGPATESRLNLITCNGKWLKDKRVYDERLVVVTRRVVSSQ